MRRIAWLTVALGVGGLVFVGVANLAWGETEWFFLVQALGFILLGWVLLREQRMVR